MRKLSKIVLGLFLVACTSASAYAIPVDFAINAGGWSYETSWSIEQVTGGTWSEGMAYSTMLGNTDYIYNWDLGAGDYLLQMWDSFGDGLDGAGGRVYLAVDGDVLLDEVGRVFGHSYSLAFVVGGDQGNGAAPVPEPSTVVLLGLGLLGLVGFGRKRMNR